MALTGMQIYKLLPKTNCKDCGFPTCMAFAMQVAAKQKAITDCPHLSEEAKAQLSEASAPPMKLVKIGPEGKAFEIGQETVMFRHEEKFHRPCGIAARIGAELTDEEALKKVEKANKSVFERVGETLSVKLIAIELDGVNNPVDRVKKCAEKSELPIILVSEDEDTIAKSVEPIKDLRPLLYRANSKSIDKLSEIAASKKIPLAIFSESLEEMAELSEKAKNKGVSDIVLSFEGKDIGETLRKLTIARRACLKKTFRPLGFPTIVNIKEETPEKETVVGSIFAAKYAGIIIIDSLEPWVLLPIMTTIQNIYTDPQVPNTVEAKLYEIGNPDENSPVMFTTNFSLTYFSVEAEVERSKIPAYISVVDTEGLGVLNAYAGDKISAEKVVKTLKEQKVAEKVKHRKLIIPGLLPVFRAEIEDTSEWEEVIIGPENAREIPAFLNKIWKK